MGNFFFYLRGICWLSGFLALIGIGGYLKWTRFEGWTDIRGNAVVTAIVTDSQGLIHPVLEFSDMNGPYAVQCVAGSPRGSYHVGETVSIRYPRLSPGEVVIVTWRRWLPVLVLGIIAGVSFLLGVGLHFLEDRADKREDAKLAAGRAARLAAQGTQHLTR